MDRPPYLPDVALCDFWLFSQVKSQLKVMIWERGLRQRKSGGDSQQADRIGFPALLYNLKTRMERWRNRQGEYIEGDKVSSAIRDEQKVLRRQSGYVIATSRIAKDASLRKCRIFT